ncbi:MAG: TlpA family protein disulfide reductase [Akkermansiaceae bacterium]
MKLKLKTLAIASAATVAITGTAQAYQGAAAPEQAAAAAAAAVEILGVGSVAPALEGVTWIQGDEVKSMDEKGKLYIVECWATWCGPCVAIIPHMNDLHKKYADKGLVIVGMNVWEEGVEKSEDFVKAQGDGMSYRVAYSGGKESKFTTSWLEASQTNGIPQAFAVRDGKIIYKGHPGGLSEKTIEKMMEENFNAEEFAKQQAEEQAKSQAFSKKIQELFQAQDWAGIKELAMTDEFVKGKRDAAGLIAQANEQLGDWDEQSAHLKDIVDGKYGSDTKATQILGYGFATVVVDDKVKALAAQLEPLYATEGGPADKDYYARVAHSRVLFLVGKTDEAVKQLESVKTAISDMKDQPGAAEFIAKLDESIAGIKDGKFAPFQ